MHTLQLSKEENAEGRGKEENGNKAGELFEAASRADTEL